MIDALIAGKLRGTPSQRTSKNGNPFTVAKVLVPASDGNVFCNVIAFNESAQASLAGAGGWRGGRAGGRAQGRRVASPGRQHAPEPGSDGRPGADQLPRHQEAPDGAGRAQRADGLLTGTESGDVIPGLSQGLHEDLLRFT